MSVIATHPPAALRPAAEAKPVKVPRIALSWGTVLLALIQSGCAIIVLIQRIAVPLGAVTLASVQHRDRFFHQDGLRLPVLALATLGAVLNLYALWNSWRLRRRPEAQWRIRPLPRAKKARNAWVVLSSVLTLALVTGELVIHRHYHPISDPAAAQHAHSAEAHRGA